MSDEEEAGLPPSGATGAQLKQSLTDAHSGKVSEHQGKTERFDPGASTLGTDNEAGTEVDHEGMSQARKAPRP